MRGAGVAPVLLAAGALGAIAGYHGEPPALPPARANDNRAPAGRLAHDTLTIRLLVGMTEWRPEADSGPAIAVPAFAEEGQRPEIPGPLLRVPAGTVIHATIRNGLADSTVWLHGFLDRPAARNDSLALRPGEVHELCFVAGAPGSYLYWAVLGKHDPEKDDERETAAGALIVDPPGGSPPDRVLVLNIWGQTLDSTHYRNALAINGRSWPYNERITARVGDTVRWRVLNPTARPHPMHLHGFFFDVSSRGDGLTDTAYAPGAWRRAVTEDMMPLETIALRWVPDRPGNWLFHCHIGFHVVPDTRLDPPPPMPESHDRMAEDPRVHMAGLVLGITVRPARGWRAPPRVAPRSLRLFVLEGKRRGRAPRAMAFVLQRAAAAPAPDSVEIPGSVLVLHRDEPTDITVVNRLHEPAAIHWHGLELESWSDGVAGWSGAGNRLARSIEPGDSFVAHLTMPRAGTFMYHTHMNDLEQLTSGLYGAIVVLEPGARFDPETDHVLVAGWDGPEDPPHLLVNGDSLPAPLELKAGVTHRLRFVNIGPAGRWRWTIQRDSAAATWTALAKDGADLPPAQAAARPASQEIDVGETYDFGFRPEPGEYRLVACHPRTGKVLWSRRLVVR